LFAASIARKKTAEVWLLDKNPYRAKRLRETGIKIEGIKSDFKVNVDVTARVQDIKECDIVLLCVKSYDTEGAVKKIASILKDDSNVLSLQNGLGNLEMISEVVGREKVLGGVIHHGATLIAEGCTYHAGVGETIIGRTDKKLTVAMRQIREIFNKSGFSTRLSRDINSVIWSKLIINAGINVISALTRLHNGQLTEHEGTREVLAMVVSEAVRVAKRKRIKLQYEDPIQKVESVCRATAKNLSSMLQDVINSKLTEVDSINGAIVRQAKSLNLPTPANLILTDLMKSVENSYVPKQK